MMWCLKDRDHQVSEFESFFQRPGHCHVSGVDDETERKDDVGNETIPFLSAEAALASVFGRKTEEQVGCVDALMKCLSHALAIGCNSIIVDECCVGEAEEFCWRERRM